MGEMEDMPTETYQSLQRSGTIFGQESPCGRRCDQFCTLLRSQLGQEEVGRRRDHVLRSVDKKIEGWRGIHHGFSIWVEGGVGMRGEIVPEKFQKGHDVWAQVSWKGRVFGD